jgi:ABC-type polysaccharide/polyol phosphate export permease
VAHAELALRDLADGAKRAPAWLALGWNDVRQRYRRSTLGPLWLTISTAILIAAMGPLYGKLFGQAGSEYILHLAVGIVVWQAMAGVANDACTTFTASDAFIKQMSLPLSFYAYRIVWRNFILFLHNALVLVPIFYLFDAAPAPRALFMVAGVAFLLADAIWMALLLGMLCARFRDVPQIIANLVQVSFFLTPIIWSAPMLGRHEHFLMLNPFYHVLELIRRPLIGSAVGPELYLGAGVVFVFGAIVTVLLFARLRTRIAFWL